MEEIRQDESKQRGAIPNALSDAEIRALLTPRSLLERSSFAVPMLNVLCRFQRLPAQILLKAVGKKGNYTSQGNVIGQLKDTGYVLVQKGKNPHVNRACIWVEITSKGREALKRYLKKK